MIELERLFHEVGVSDAIFIGSNRYHFVILLENFQGRREQVR